MALTLSTRGLAGASARNPCLTIGVWTLLLVLSMALVSRFLAGALTTEQGFSNTPEAKRGFDLIESRLRGPQKDREAVIVTSSTKILDDPAYRAYVDSLYAQITGLGPEYIAQALSYYQTNAPSLVSADRRTTLISLTLAGNIDEANDHAGKVVDIVRAASGTGGFDAYVSGNASIGHEFQEVSNRDLSSAEQLGIPIALAILILVFGAVVAALIPIVLALFAIVLALGVTALIGLGFHFSFFVTNMITMMGLAVGIDYSLFIVSRFREERRHGLDKIAAIAAAGGTAGRAVLFSGMTVILALLGMLIIPTTIFRSLAGGAIIVVVISVISSLTLLPAVLSLLGDRVNRLSVPFFGQGQTAFAEDRPGGFWDMVARTVMRHPVISVIVVTSLLIAAAVPYLDIQTGNNGVSSLPDSFQAKKGFLLLEKEFSGGQVFPAEVVIDGPANSSQVQTSIDRLKAAVSRDPIFGPSVYETNAAGDLGLLSISMAVDPSTRQAVDAIGRLRAEVPAAFQDTPARVFVTGQSAMNRDFFHLTDSYTPVVFVFVLGLSFVLLTLVFRSLVVPAKAILMNLLSVGAAYGLVVLVCQKGFGVDILGFKKVDAIEAWLPLFLFSILFGLSMDYHVFLLSRIREHYDETGDNTESVAFGVRSTGRLITGAALIMVAVFSGFARGEMVMFQQFGFGLAVAVLVDATVIRSVLVPASMKLLGKANWYLPAVLEWLPHVGIDAEQQVRRTPAARRIAAEVPPAGE